MNLRRSYLLTFLILLLVISPVPTARVQTLPVVHAVLFYSPSPGHCYYVITETLPFLVAGFPGDQSLFSAINVTLDGQTYAFRVELGRPLWSGGNGKGNGCGGS